ncbi:MAG: thiamine phosphate synthase [Gammaproteobacteria bacterium]|nr:MAG: thiamine phosphate synthase [Gammaproteobacteria bacterium]
MPTGPAWGSCSPTACSGPVSSPTDTRARWRGLYAITDPARTPGPRLFEAVAAALRGGARVVQYRNKTAPPGVRRDEAARLAALCRAHGAPFLVNDDPRLAAEVEADGVHLGREDPELRQARRLLGPRRWIGISCYNRLERARQAQDAGADYVAFGRFFPSRTKPEAVPATPALLRAARRELRLPVVAIGGITPENGRVLIEAGADMLAVIHALFGQPDVEAAARALARLFEPGVPHDPIP